MNVSLMTVLLQAVGLMSIKTALVLEAFTLTEPAAHDTVSAGSELEITHSTNWCHFAYKNVT